MDHDDVREVMELAAAEPGGLDRLMAGDTPDAAAVASHLAGCPDCTAELARLREASVVIAEVVATTLPADLLDRTLAHVRAHGVPRGASVAPAPAPVAPVAEPAGIAAPTPMATAERRSSRPGRSVLTWVAGVAAAVVISVAATTVIVGSRVDDRLAAQAQEIDELSGIVTATLTVTGSPDAEHLAMTSPSGATETASLVFSPTTTELVVVATGLTEPGEGLEYRCWVEVDGQRQPIGKMFFGGDLAYWAGPSPAVQGLGDGVTFGMSLVDEGGVVGPDPVLVGTT